jgi:hypothetical protein
MCESKIPVIIGTASSTTWKLGALKFALNSTAFEFIIMKL